jgi:hypothetical protein
LRAAGGFDAGLDLCGVGAAGAEVQQQRAAGGGQLLGDGGADAATGAGDEHRRASHV